MDQFSSLPLWLQAVGIILLLAVVIVLFFVLKNLVKLMAGLVVLSLLALGGGYLYFYKTEPGRDHLRNLQNHEVAPAPKETNLVEGISESLKRGKTNLLNQGKDKLKQEAKDVMDRLFDPKE